MNHGIFETVIKFIFGIGFALTLYGIFAAYLELFRIWKTKGFNPVTVILKAHKDDEDVKAFRKRHFSRVKRVAVVILLLMFVLFSYIEFR